MRAAILTFGTLQDLRGEAGLSRLSMLAAGGDIGGPIVANNNVVIGMLPPAKAEVHRH